MMREWDPRKNPLLIPSSIGMRSRRRSSEPSRRPTHPLPPSGGSPCSRPPTPMPPISDPRAAACPIGGGPPPPRQEAAPPIGCPLLRQLGFGVSLEMGLVSLPVLAEGTDTDKGEEAVENRPITGIKNTITGRQFGDMSRRSGIPTKRERSERTEEIITFSDEDAQGVQYPHNDAVVIVINIANHNVHRVLVNSGSCCNILFYDAFFKMGFTLDQLKRLDHSLVDFCEKVVPVEGVITLPVTAGRAPRQSTVQLDFVVVKVFSAYNAFLGRPGLIALRAIISTRHLLVKFPTRQGVGEIRGDQALAQALERQCCVNTLREARLLDAPPVEGWDVHGQANPGQESSSNENFKMKYPAMIFRGEIIYSRTAPEVELATKKILDKINAMKHISGQVSLGFDIEWRPVFKRGEASRKAAVMQICMDNSHCYVMHIIHSGIPPILKSLLEGNSSVKVGIGVAKDASKISKDYNVCVEPVEDLSSLANLKLGGAPRNWSLSSLTEMITCKQLEKPHKIRLGNWETDVLSREQLQYAATDAFASWYLYQVLKGFPDAKAKAEDVKQTSHA